MSVWAAQSDFSASHFSISLAATSLCFWALEYVSAAATDPAPQDRGKKDAAPPGQAITRVRCGHAEKTGDS
ncbi:hypothetical protein GCM10011315_28210 [Roseovarius pacificus]|nr:hypothetical protein GCM10011315_28210 [Roseovarius pacificus]